MPLLIAPVSGREPQTRAHHKLFTQEEAEVGRKLGICQHSQGVTEQRFVMFVKGLRKGLFMFINTELLISIFFQERRD